MILVIDNYDSFTYNLVQYFGQLGREIAVFRNDSITLERIEELSPESIVISPGPGRPDDAGISKSVIIKFQGRIPILGVCLGNQCIGEVYGASVVRSRNIMHGKVSQVYHKGDGIFRNIPSPFIATRYHSLIVDPETLRYPLELTAWTSSREVMGICHKNKPIWGVQFHPESVLTTEGMNILRNFVNECKINRN